MMSISGLYRNKFPQVGLAILLGLVLFVEVLASTLSYAQQIQQSAMWQPLYAISISTILTLWVHYDSRTQNISLGIDQAMLIFFAWPVTFPYYAFRSRGFRSGVLLLLSFMGIYLLALVAAFFVSVNIGIGIAIMLGG